jgi:hypothetical protein
VVVMLKYGLGILAMLFAMAGDAQAGAVHRVSCTVVRFYVAKYSAGAAESWARSHGASDAEIENARRCLSPGSLQTASFSK